MRLLNDLRKLRLRLLTSRELSNGADVWEAYSRGTAIPPLRFRDGLTLYHGPGDAPVFLLFEIFANGCYRTRMPRQILGPVIDLGANIGAFVLDCARRFPDTVIHAYEPHPVTVETLRRNVVENRLQDRVHVYAEAVGKAPGTMSLSAADMHLAASAYGPGEPAFTVPAVDFATVLARAGGRAGLVKIDVEGAEADILESAAGALEHVDAVVGEFHEWLVPGVRARLVAALQRSGFRASVSEGGRCGPMFHGTRL